MTRHTRRALLGFGGLLAGGATALAAPGGSGALADVAKKRLTLAQEALKVIRQAIGRGGFNPGERDPVYIWSRRRLEARLDLSTTKAERVAAAREHLEEMKQVEQLINRMHEEEGVNLLTKLDAQYRRLEAESALEEEKAKA